MGGVHAWYAAVIVGYGHRSLVRLIISQTACWAAAGADKPANARV